MALPTSARVAPLRGGVWRLFLCSAIIGVGTGLAAQLSIRDIMNLYHRRSSDLLPGEEEGYLPMGSD